MIDSEIGIVLSEALDDGATASKSMFGSKLILDVVMGSSLKLMWAMVNTLQIIAYFSVIKVNMAVHATNFLK